MISAAGFAKTWQYIQLFEQGLICTLSLSALTVLFGFVLALILALMRMSKVKPFSWFATAYVELFRATPMLVQLFIIFYGLPNIGLNIPAFPSAVIAFSLNVGAYASETIRGAILAVPKSQTEGALACGLTNGQSITYIVLPQAAKACIPALFNTFISLVKDTSLAANITITEMFMATQRIVAVTYEPLALYIEVALVYLLFSTGLTALQRYMEKRLNIKPVAAGAA